MTRDDDTPDVLGPGTVEQRAWIMLADNVRAALDTIACRLPDMDPDKAQAMAIAANWIASAATQAFWLEMNARSFDAKLEREQRAFE